MFPYHQLVVRENLETGQRMHERWVAQANELLDFGAKWNNAFDTLSETQVHFTRWKGI